MEALRIKKHILSTTIDIPEFQNYIGKNAEMIILIETPTELKKQFVLESENDLKKCVSVKNIMHIPANKRKSIIAKQFKEAITLYNENPELIIEDVDSYIDYESEELC